MTQEYSSQTKHTEANPREAQIRVLKQRLADLEARWPQHSVPPAMLQELEDIEDQLAELEGD